MCVWGRGGGLFVVKQYFVKMHGEILYVGMPCGKCISWHVNIPHFNVSPNLRLCVTVSCLARGAVREVQVEHFTSDQEVNK